MTETEARSAGHFPGCHPEDAQAPDSPPSGPGFRPQETETCWHCGTPTPHGCDCWECQDGEYIPPSAIYHCQTCGRWWAWMTGLNVTTVTFGEEPDA